MKGQNFVWQVKEYSKEMLWLTKIESPKGNSGNEWNYKIAFHYFKADRKMPLVMVSHSFNNPEAFDDNGHGYYLYFFGPEGKGDLIRGHYVGYSGPAWDSSNFKASTTKLPGIIRKELSALPSKDSRLISSINEDSYGLEDSEIFSRFGKEKSLIELYSESIIFYDDPKKNIRPPFSEEQKEGAIEFNKGLCEAVGAALEKLVDQSSVAYDF